jgi:hypothetical protein
VVACPLNQAARNQMRLHPTFTNGLRPPATYPAVFLSCISLIFSASSAPLRWVEKVEALIAEVQA